jgi:exocyst complex component 4
LSQADIALMQDSLEQRREAEVHALAGNQANGETRNRDSTDVASQRRSIFAPTEARLNTVALDAAGSSKHTMVLRDLFWTLYSKLGAVFEGHRVVYEVARWISAVSAVADTVRVTLNIV